MPQHIQNNFLNGILVISLLLTAYLITSYYDYQDIVDRVTPIKYNCDMLIGGWHPDVPTKVLEECRKKQYETYRNQKQTYY